MGYINPLEKNKNKNKNKKLILQAHKNKISKNPLYTTENHYLEKSVDNSVKNLLLKKKIIEINLIFC